MNKSAIDDKINIIQHKLDEIRPLYIEIIQDIATNIQNLYNQNDFNSYVKYITNISNKLSSLPPVMRHTILTTYNNDHLRYMVNCAHSYILTKRSKFNKDDLSYIESMNKWINNL